MAWGPAMTDVAYFLGCALPNDVRREHYDTLLRAYHGALGPDGPLSLDEFERIRGGGWDLPTLQRVVDQFVIHYDVCGTSRQCFRILAACKRGACQDRVLADPTEIDHGVSSAAGRVPAIDSRSWYSPR